VGALLIVGPLVELVSGVAESELPAFCKNLDVVGTRKHQSPTLRSIGILGCKLMM